MKQFPIFPPEFYRAPQPWQATGQTFGDWVRVRVLELTCTAYDLKNFAEDCGWTGPPFAWDEVRRGVLRAELDAATFMRMVSIVTMSLIFSAKPIFQLLPPGNREFLPPS